MVEITLSARTIPKANLRRFHRLTNSLGHTADGSSPEIVAPFERREYVLEASRFPVNRSGEWRNQAFSPTTLPAVGEW
jgi:hypothetical protein